VRALTGPAPRRRPWAAALALALALASGTAALTVAMAVHQRIEAAQLAYDRAPAQTVPRA
jgi:H+/gluconate symporter-like permease